MENKDLASGKKFAVIGGETTKVDGKSLGTWKVVLKNDRDHLICSFAGGASQCAAMTFFDFIENSPKWSA